MIRSLQQPEAIQPLSTLTSQMVGTMCASFTPPIASGQQRPIQWEPDNSSMYAGESSDAHAYQSITTPPSSPTINARHSSPVKRVQHVDDLLALYAAARVEGPRSRLAIDSLIDIAEHAPDVARRKDAFNNVYNISVEADGSTASYALEKLAQFTVYQSPATLDQNHTMGLLIDALKHTHDVSKPVIASIVRGALTGHPRKALWKYIEQHKRCWPIVAHIARAGYPYALIALYRLDRYHAHTIFNGLINRCQNIHDVESLVLNIFNAFRYSFRDIHGTLSGFFHIVGGMDTAEGEALRQALLSIERTHRAKDIHQLLGDPAYGLPFVILNEIAEDDTPFADDLRIQLTKNRQRTSR